MNARLSPVVDTDGQVQRAPAGGVTMRRVLFVTYEFPPSLEIGAQACAQLTRYLPLHGWEPTVLTVRERYHPSVDRSLPDAVAGRVIRTRMMPHPLAVYRRVKTAFGFGAHRQAASEVAAEPVRPSSSPLRRGIISLLDTPDRYTGWILPAVVAGLREIRRRRIEHICSSAPYWSSHLVGLALARLTGLPWTAHFRDPWTTTTNLSKEPFETPLGRRLDVFLERMVVSNATFVVALTERHTRLLRDTYSDVTPERFVTIPNGFDEAEWSWQSQGNGHSPHPARAKFVITYAGQLYLGRNPLPLFRALRRLIDSGIMDPSGVAIDLVGWWEVAEGRRVAAMIEDCGLRACVTLTGPVSRSEALRRMEQSSLLLLLCERQTDAIPGKTYEYLRSGRPILALTGHDSSLADLLQVTKGAWIVDPTDETRIASSIRQTYEAWTRGEVLPASDPAVVSTFDRRLLVQRLAELFTRASPPSVEGHP